MFKRSLLVLDLTALATSCPTPSTNPLRPQPSFADTQRIGMALPKSERDEAEKLRKELASMATVFEKSPDGYCDRQARQRISVPSQRKSGRAGRS